MPCWFVRPGILAHRGDPEKDARLYISPDLRYHYTARIP